MKGQTVRLVDVFVLGPFMVWSAARMTSAPEWARVGMVGAGLATIVYNGRNYLAVSR